MGLEFIYPALPTWLVVCVQKSDFHLINVFCVVIVVKKHKLLSLAQVFSYFVLHTAQQQDIFGSHDQSYTFGQPAVQTARWS